MANLNMRDHWEALLKFLPEGWEQEAFNKKAMTRKREIKTPETLLRVLFMHLAEGLSLRSTSTWASQAGLCHLNDSALLGRLRHSQEWLRWLAQSMRNELNAEGDIPKSCNQFRVRLIDASVVCEPGSTGSDWRLHYSMNLRNLQCESFKVTDGRVGETFKNFNIRENDLLIADRAYCSLAGTAHVLSSGGHVLARYHQVMLPLKTRSSVPLEILTKLKGLEVGEIADFDVYIDLPGARLTKGRIIAVRKTQEAVDAEVKRLMLKASRQQRKVSERSLELAKYVTLFTTMNRHRLKKEEALSLYKSRWQIELAFKRMKSILSFGHLPKKDTEGCKAWLHGKMLVALLVERIHREAEFFSPWGYKLFERKAQ